MSLLSCSRGEEEDIIESDDDDEEFSDSDSEHFSEDDDVWMEIFGIRYLMQQLLIL